MSTIIDILKISLKWYFIYLVITTLVMFFIMIFVVLPSFDKAVLNTLVRDDIIVKIHRSDYKIKDSKLKEFVDNHVKEFEKLYTIEEKELLDELSKIKKVREVGGIGEFYGCNRLEKLLVINKNRNNNTGEQNIKKILSKYSQVEGCNETIDLTTFIKN